MNIRDIKIDIIKAIGIILVVLGHTQMSLCGFVNLFHVGLFFIASGYCYQEKYSDTWSNMGLFLMKRIKGLYIPFVLWNVGYLCFRNLFSIIGIYNTSQIGLRAFVKQGLEIVLLRAGEELAGPCWFVRALFILEVLFVIVDSVIKKITKDRNVHILRIVFSIGMLAVGAWLNGRDIMLQYNMGIVCSAWILYVLGLEWKHLITIKNMKFSDTRKNLLGFMVSFGILIVLSCIGSISYDSNSYPNAVFFLLAAIAGWAMTWSLAAMIENAIPKLAKSLVFIGRRTMSILFLHLFSFKIISAVYMYVNGAGKYIMANFPVITNKWWIGYWIAGVGVSLAICVLAEKAKEKFKHYAGIKRIVLTGVFFAILFIVPYTIVYGVNRQEIFSMQNNDALNYSLVYDEDYYLNHNTDIARVVGGNSEEALKHFIVNGMDEGRIASENFDVYYYKDANGDLAENYGGNLRRYYQHFMSYGYAEGRKGSKTSGVIYDSELKAEIADDSTVKFTIKLNNQVLSAIEYYIFRVPAYEEGIADSIYLAEGKFGETEVITCEKYDIEKYLNYKYVAAKKTDSGFEIISNFAYVDNAEVLCDTNVERPVVDSKKGLQIINSMMEDIEQLDPSYPFMNLIIETIMMPNNADGNAIVYSYKGREYYFRSDKISEYDQVISQLTQNGAIVTASVLSVKSEGFDELYYPDIAMDTGAAYYAVNTSTENGLRYLEAFVSFMSNRYNGTSLEKGLIANWIVGNEVNESGTYNYMGEKEIHDYLKEYTRTFRVIYNIVKSNIGMANVYVPMEPWWGIDSNMLTYGGREFLTLFNKMMDTEGNVDWGLAYHAYSFPLSDPKVLNDTERTIDETGELTLDGYVTTDSDYSVTITMENIEVLTEFMRKETFLNKNGEVRSIILSEQGYTSNSNLYGKCEAQQAASMVYAYYKAEMNEDIDAFIYFLQVDNTAASLGNNYYLFGLWGQQEDGTLSKKLSHKVYEVMDTCQSLQELDYIKNILGIEAWEEVIPNFKENIFLDFKEWNSQRDTLKNINLAQVDEIVEQKYTGQECLPEICVSMDEMYLENDVDYDVVYLDNIEVGEAKAVIVGLNEFTGIKEISFMVEK